MNSNKHRFMWQQTLISRWETSYDCRRMQVQGLTCTKHEPEGKMMNDEVMITTPNLSNICVDECLHCRFLSHPGLKNRVLEPPYLEVLDY